MQPDAVAMIAALNHPLRRRILRRFEENEGTKTSAARLAAEFDLPLGNISYHLQSLSKLKILSLAEVRRIRGAREFVFISNLDGEEGWFRSALEESRAADERGAG